MTKIAYLGYWSEEMILLMAFGTDTANEKLAFGFAILSLCFISETTPLNQIYSRARVARAMSWRSSSISL